MSRIHPLASVDPKANIGDDVEIGPFCVIGPHVTIGRGSVLLNNVTIAGHTTLGSGNKLYPNVALGCDPQDKKFVGETTRLEIGDNNLIREHCTIHVGTAKGGGITRVGSGNLFMVNAHIGHDTQWGNNTILGNNCMVAGHVHCGDYAAIMSAVGIHHFVTVGPYCYVSAINRVTTDVPPFVKIDEDNTVRALNILGLRRAGIGEADIEALDQAVRKIFLRRRGTPMSTVLKDYAPGTGQTTLVDQLVESINRRGSVPNGRYMESMRHK